MNPYSDLPFYIVPKGNPYPKAFAVMAQDNDWQALRYAWLICYCGRLDLVS